MTAADVSSENREFSRRHDIEAIALISVAHASSHFYHLVIPSLFPWIMKAFGLSFTEAGFLMTSFFVTSAIGQAASGFLVDRFGPLRVLCAGLTSLAVSAFLVGAAPSYAFLFLGAVIAGLGNSVFHPADYSLINYNISVSRLGHAFAWHGVTGNIGWAVCPLFMVTAASLVGWRGAAFLASVTAILVLTAVWIRRGTLSRSQISASEKKSVSGAGSTAFGFLAVPAVWLCFFFFFFTSGAFGVLQSYSPTIFGKAYGLSISEASTALTAYLVSAGAGGLLGGFFTNNPKVPSGRVVGLAFGAAALTAVVLALQWFTGYWAIVLMAFMGFGVGLAGPSRDIMIRKATISKLGLGTLGRVYGFTYCGMDVGQSLSPVLFGPLLDAGHYSMALAGVAVLQVCGIFCALTVGGRKEEQF